MPCPDPTVSFVPNNQWTQSDANIYNNNPGAVWISPNVGFSSENKLRVNGTSAFSASATSDNAVLSAYSTSANGGLALYGYSPNRAGVGGAFYGGLRGLYAELTSREDIAAIQANGSLSTAQ